jgi:hypothetical protein
VTTLRAAAARLIADATVADYATLALLAAACWSTYAPPTAVGIVAPTTFHSIWNVRVGPASLFELGVVVVAVLRVRERRWRLGPRSSLDAFLFLLLTGIAALALFAIERGELVRLYGRHDLEVVVLVLVGYLLASRLTLSRDVIATAALGVSALLLFRAYELTLQHGIIGSTQFGTVTGRMALLITEDTLLVGLPLCVFLGFAVDRLLPWPWLVAAGAAAGLGIVAIDIVSVRRGALAFLTLALLVRLFVSRPAFGAVAVAVAVVVAAAAVATGRAGPVVGDLRYVVKSAVFQTHDQSVSQRSAEVTELTDNMQTRTDWLFGRGLGASWNATQEATTQVASFGGKETPFVRLGWHVYGFDWIYRFGLLGTAALAFVVLVTIRRANRLVRRAEPLLRSLTVSFLTFAPILLLFAFSNQRLALFAGFTLGTASAVADLALGASAEAAETPPVPDAEPARV